MEGAVVVAGDDTRDCVMAGVTDVLLAGEIVVVKPVVPEQTVIFCESSTTGKQFTCVYDFSKIALSFTRHQSFSSGDKLGSRIFNIPQTLQLFSTLNSLCHHKVCLFLMPAPFARCDLSIPL